MAETIIEMRDRIARLRDDASVEATNAIFARQWEEARYLSGRAAGLDSAMTEILSVLLERMEGKRDGN